MQYTVEQTGIQTIVAKKGIKTEALGPFTLYCIIIAATPVEILTLFFILVQRI